MSFIKKLKIFAHKIMIAESFTGKVKEIEAGKWKKKSSLCMQRMAKRKLIYQNMCKEQSKTMHFFKSYVGNGNILPLDFQTNSSSSNSCMIQDA